MPSLTITDWTMPLIGKTVAPNSIGNKTGLLGEFDCDLHIAWWGEGDDEFGWELEAVTVDWLQPNERHSFTETSDPQLWVLIQRGFKFDEVKMAERILERIHEALDDEKYSPEHYEDVSMGR